MSYVREQVCAGNCWCKVCRVREWRHLVTEIRAGDYGAGGNLHRHAHAGGGKGPKQLAGFVDGTNPAAKAIVLTRTTAGPAAMGGLDITMAPLSLYAYWLQRDPTLRNFHPKG